MLDIFILSLFPLILEQIQIYLQDVVKQPFQK